jgi:hypothetical protein
LLDMVDLFVRDRGSNGCYSDSQGRETRVVDDVVQVPNVRDAM